MPPLTPRSWLSRRHRPAVVFVEATDPRVIEAACRLPRFIRPVFLASEMAVKAVAHSELRHVDPTRIEFTLAESAFVDVRERTDLVDEFARACTELPRAIRRTDNLAEARELMSTRRASASWLSGRGTPTSSWAASPTSRTTTSVPCSGCWPSRTC